ncbi:AAA family ATPase [Raoultella terrigena]|uniref:AAA family ATPase n=1 Tax=Raoultella terrigena TaxID=577 RepID=UPI002DB9070C|nr:ATP-binding protein [Raoultella terrigena]MEB7598087.1 ATP-binding protein [Raoultella terrigena]
MNTSELMVSLIKSGVTGDKITFQRMAAKVAREMDADGNRELAQTIRNLLKQGASFSLQKANFTSSELSTSDLSLPTDSETKFHLADKVAPDDNARPPVLNDSINEKIDEFIVSVEKRNELKKYGLKPASSMILFGPPGCGKTLAAKHIASALGLPLFTARCDALVSSYLGSTAKNIRTLFEYASNQPCVLFLDELDALAKARDDQHELGELKRVVVALLQNIDDLPEHTVLISASNHENLLDSAVWRRFAYRIEIGLPDIKIRDHLFERLLNEHFPTLDIAYDAALLSKGLSCAFIEQICERALRHSILFNNSEFDNTFLMKSILESQGEKFDDPDQTIGKLARLLRNCDSKVFTVRKIASLLSISPAKVSRLTKENKSTINQGNAEEN